MRHPTIKLFLLLYYRRSFIPHPDEGTPPFSYAIESLIADGLLERKNILYDLPTYCLTERGHMFVEMLCETPLPE